MSSFEAGASTASDARILLFAAEWPELYQPRAATGYLIRSFPWSYSGEAVACREVPFDFTQFVGSTQYDLLSDTTGYADLLSDPWTIRSYGEQRRNRVIAGWADLSPESSKQRAVYTYFTSVLGPDEELIERMFAAARDSSEEDRGANFRNEVNKLLYAYGNAAVHAMGRYIAQEKASPNAAWEVLCYLGDVSEPTTSRARIEVLERALFHRSPIVRDAASVGLANMNDHSCIVHLERAIEREKNSLVRESLGLALRQIRLSQ